MKYIKLFEYYRESYIRNKDMFFSSDIFDYLGVYDKMMYDENNVPESAYNVDVIDFLKEIFLNKKIIFDPVNNLNNISGTVTDVTYFVYKDLYIKVKMKDENEYLIDNNRLAFIFDYDADTKPLHKEVEMKKKAEKYNL
jgi:hypothetical protein